MTTESIREREERWVAEQSLADLCEAIYSALPNVIAANDLEGRKPYLALERLVAENERLRDRLNRSRLIALSTVGRAAAGEPWNLWKPPTDGFGL